ncbi:hypothetical protein [Demequina sediminicola]|uniref:hypothetical protein n=1 Tax=Demequina sediminicola TaxID=1095026 RepID=UPI00128C0096|nr:hypothetical protein [Demequina sediminicola]
MRSYRSPSAPMWGWIGIAAGVLIAVLGTLVEGFPVAFVPITLGAAIALIAVACFLRPKVEVDDHSVIVHNITQVVEVPFARLADVETQWGLELVTDDGKKVGAFAAPDPNRRDRRKAPHEHKSADLVAMVRGGESAWLEGPHRAQDEQAWADAPSRVRHWDFVGVALLASAAVLIIAGIALV